MDPGVGKTVDWLAGWVRETRLETPFVFLLESHRPVLRIMGHGLNIFEPIAAGFMGLERVERLRNVLFDSEAADALLDNLKAAPGVPGTEPGVPGAEEDTR